MAGCMSRSTSAADLTPAGRAGLDAVRTRPRAPARLDGHRVETQRELLVNAAVRVDEHVRGVAVDPGQPGDLDRHPGLLGDLANQRLADRLPDFDAPAGQLPVAVVDPAHHQHLPGIVADGRERRRQHVVRARRARIPVVLVQPHHGAES